MSYATDAEVKAALNISDTKDDAAVALATEAASRLIDGFTNRRFDKTVTVEARLYTATATNGRVVTDDIATATGLVVEADGATLTDPDDYRLHPLNAGAHGMPWTYLSGTDWPTEAGAVKVTATFGWPAVPAEVRQAALIQSIRLMQRRHSPYGIAGSPEQGSEMRLLSRLDPDVENLLRHLRRPWVVA
jgi:hypothetical protein